MNKKPLVSIICLCYNQSRFVQEAIESVWNQTYDNIQLIVVDDCSTDDSVTIIEQLIEGKNFPFIKQSKNQGNTIAFNKGLKLVKGKYVVDLSGDDVLDLERIRKQVEFFEAQHKDVGVIYSDAMYISEDGKKLSIHFQNDKLISRSGDIYIDLIERYFIPTPTMMIRKEVFDELNGYDENLVYEDFDFWIRSSRNWQYRFQNEVLTYIRRVEGSFSTNAYAQHNNHIYSTYLVCKKIKNLNANDKEISALSRRMKYEIRHASISGNHYETDLFIQLLKEIEILDLSTRAFMLINKLKIDFSFLRDLYHKLRY